MQLLKSHRSRAGPATCLFDLGSELEVLSRPYFEKEVEDLSEIYIQWYITSSYLSFLILILGLNLKV